MTPPRMHLAAARARAIGRLAWLALLALLAAPASIGPPAARAETPPAPRWEPPPDHWDWVQIKSQEWLKGEIRAMQNKSLEFYSDKFKRLELDWYDVRYLRSPKPFAVMSGDELVTGPLRTEDGQLVVVGSPDVRMPFVEVESITTGLPRELDKWRFKVSAGVLTRSGNSESQDFTGQVALTRRTPNSRVLVGYNGSAGQTGGIQTSNNHRATVGADLRLDTRWFARVPQFEYYRDPFQNIRSRFTLGAGAGYRISDRKDFDWWVATGPAYQQVRFVTVAAGEPASESTPSLFLQSYLDRDLVTNLDLHLAYSGVITSPNAGLMTHHTVVMFDFGIGWRWNLDLSLTWDRIERPQTAADGSTPKKDDFRTSASLGIDL